MEDQIKLFDDYLMKKLSGIERINFEKQLTEDAAMRKAFEQHRDAVKAIQFAALKDKMNKISLEEQKSNTLNLRQAIAIAASLVILAGAFFYLSNQVDDPVTSEEIFASVHFKDPGLPTLMGEDDTDAELDQFMIQYKLGKYDEALAMGEHLNKVRPENDTIQYYLAMTLLESGNTARSKELLDDLKNPYSVIGQKSQWYLYLIALRDGDVDFAKQGIESISEDEDHIFRLDAIEALDVINMIEH